MFSVGNVLCNRYELKRFIAPGGMGEVWEAVDTTLSRTVALKVVNPSYLHHNPKASVILHEEAKAGSALIGHPNVVTVLDFGQTDHNSVNYYFIVMECVDGMNISDWVTEIKPKIDDVTYYHISLLIALEIVRAITFAHKQKLLHRDIKPLNIFISKLGLTKVGDFGISRFVNEATRTHTVWNLSSPQYTAPEQWRGVKPTIDTDYYQLGCTLYQLFTGVLPFDKTDLVSLMNAHLNEDPIPPNKVNDHISSALSDRIMLLLDKDPNERGVLWEVHDVIAAEIHSLYCIYGEFKDDHDGKAEKITDISIERMRQNKKPVNFPDYSEVLSEGIELILEGILDFSIRKVSAVVKDEAAATIE